MEFILSPSKVIPAWIRSSIFSVSPSWFSWTFLMAYPVAKLNKLLWSISFRISASHCGGDEFCLLGYNNCVIHWRSTNISEKNAGDHLLSHWFLAWHILLTLKLEWHVPPKCQVNFQQSTQLLHTRKYNSWNITLFQALSIEIAPDKYLPLRFIRTHLNWPT
jgi:hypothetical protein